MKQNSKIDRLCVALYISKKSCDCLELDLGGIIGDKHHGKDLDRSILIASTHSYKMARDRDIELEQGDLGENILVNFDPYQLESGTRVQISNVVLEITKMSTLCKSLTKLDSALPKLLKNDRGIFAKVIKGGVINKGDLITIVL